MIPHTCANLYCTKEVRQKGGRCIECAHYWKLAKQRQQRTNKPHPLAEVLTAASAGLEHTVKEDRKTIKEFKPVMERICRAQEWLTKGEPLNTADIQLALNAAINIYNHYQQSNQEDSQNLIEVRMWKERLQPEGL